MPPLESQALEAGPTSQDMGTHRKGLIRIMCSPRTQTHDLESRKGFLPVPEGSHGHEVEEEGRPGVRIALFRTQSGPVPQEFTHEGEALADASWQP